MIHYFFGKSQQNGFRKLKIFLWRIAEQQLKAGGDNFPTFFELAPFNT